jgi:hypothetical protein
VKNNSVEKEVNAADNLPLALGAFVNAADPTTYYRYSGSLTTPGARRVRWDAAEVLCARMLVLC